MADRSELPTFKPRIPSRHVAPQYPICPTCNRRMGVKQATPILFAGGLDVVLYACERCGTQARRTVKR